MPTTRPPGRSTLVLIPLLLLLGADPGSATAQQPGELDPSFGGTGFVTTASNVVVDSSTQITASITVGNGGPNKPRTWDLRVTNPDATSAVLPQSFMVDP